MDEQTESQTKTIDSLVSEPINPQEESRSLYRRVANWYFEPKGFEKDGKIYEKLGVHIFKKFLPTGGDYVCRRTGERLIKSRKDLAEFETLTRGNEHVHVLAAIGTAGLSAFFFFI